MLEKEMRICTEFSAISRNFEQSTHRREHPTDSGLVNSDLCAVPGESAVERGGEYRRDDDEHPNCSE